MSDKDYCGLASKADKPSNRYRARYRAWQEGGQNQSRHGGPWFVTVPGGGDIEIGYDADGLPDRYHAELFAAAGNAALDAAARGGGCR